MPIPTLPTESLRGNFLAAIANSDSPSTPVSSLMTDRFQKEWLQQHEKRELEMLALEKVLHQ